MIRFTIWNIGIRLCDVISRPVNWLLWRTEVGQSITACDLLHPSSMLGDRRNYPESWWRRFGWATSLSDTGEEE